MRPLKGPGRDLCDRCGSVASRLVLLPDDTPVLACQDCVVPLFIAITVSAVNRDDTPLTTWVDARAQA